jgi:beta-glucosidase
VASIAPPVKRLRRFVKVALASGASQQLRFTLTKNELSYTGSAGKPVTDAGIFTVMVGNLRQDVTIR